MTEAKRRNLILIMATAGSAMLAWSALAGNDVVLTGAATSLAREQRALVEARAQADSARIRSEQLEAQARDAGAKAQRTQAEAAAVAARIQESEADIRAGQARIAILGQLKVAQAHRLAEQQQPAVRLMAALQTLSRRPPALALLRPGSLRDAVRARAVLAVAMPVIEHRTAGLKADLTRARALHEMAQEANAALRTSRAQLSERQLSLEAMETRQRQAFSALSANAAQEQDRATALGEKARDIVELMSRLDAASTVEARLRSLPAPDGDDRIAAVRPGIPADGTAPYILPVTGPLVTGLGEMDAAGVRSRGLTLAPTNAASVTAPAGGTVAFAGPYRSFGQIAIIDHGDGWTSLVSGLDRIDVRKGQQIRQGDTLGLARANRPGVTVELRRHGRPVDIPALLAGG